MALYNMTIEVTQEKEQEEKFIRPVRLVTLYDLFHVYKIMDKNSPYYLLSPT